MNILHLFRAILVGAALAAAMPAHAAVAMAIVPMVNDASERRAVNDKDCADCRPRRFDGDMARVYFRGEHRVHAAGQLLVEASYCSPEIGASNFPDEEEHVAAYLNKQNYRFK
jgi:hypothetical protein